MTTLTGIELSKKVAELYGIHEWISPVYKNADNLIASLNDHDESKMHWLHDDSKRCFELMVEHSIFIDWHRFYVWSGPATSGNSFEVDISRKHDKLEATLTAILKCLVAMKENG